MTEKPEIIFDANGWQFIADISARFPDRNPSILDRFKSFYQIPAEERPSEALKASKSEPHRGMMQRGKSEEEVQSINCHSRKMVRILNEIFKTSSSLKEKYPNSLGRIIKILIHDIGEVLTTDFTPKDKINISSEEKIRLQNMAMALIFENYPEHYNAYIEYVGKKTIDDKIIKMLDVMEWIEDASTLNLKNIHMSEIINLGDEYMQAYPDLYSDLGEPFMIKNVHHLIFPNKKERLFLSAL